MKTGTNRNASVELLRILMGCAVVVLHYNFIPSGGGAVANASGFNYYLLMLLESACIVAVNVFMIISGYFSGDKTRLNLAKPVRLLAQLMIFNFIIYLVNACVIPGGDGLSLMGIISSLVPANYYVILYIVVILLSPYLNYMVAKLSDKNFKQLMMLLVMLFLVYATAVDIVEEVMGKSSTGLSSIALSGSGAGYTIVNFLLCYLIGSYLKRCDLKKFSKGGLFVGWAVSLAGVFAWSLLLPSTAWMYSNPLVMLQAVTLFMLFARREIKGQWICGLAPASFSCYLIHGALLHHIDFEFVQTASAWYLICHLFITIVAIYIISWVAQTIWDLATGKLWKWLGSRGAILAADE